MGPSISIPPPRPRLRLPFAYVAMLVGAVGIFLLIRAYGLAHFPVAAPVAAAPAVTTAPAGAHWNDVFHVLLAMATVLAVGRVLANLFYALHQPPVIGEVIAGILLGPSLLGWIWPAAFHFILPADVAPYIKMIAQLGVILYMFVVGLELNTTLLRDKGHAAVAISHASIVLPFLLGSALALWLYPKLGEPGVPFTTFALFFGVSLSITAFPVLARILTDREMTGSPLGIIALACAATDDATAWCLLALAVGVAQSSVGGALLTIALTIVFVGLMLFVARPMIRRFCCYYQDKQRERLKPNPIAFVLLCLLLSAAATEAIGIHALFGAFLLGVIIPHDSRIARDFTTKLTDIVSILFLPAFFAFTGMRTQIGLIGGWSNVLICLAIIAVATLGKFGGSTLAARATGHTWREASAVGILMNTRGLMELIVLNIGLDLGVISPTLFAMMVIMAVVTTVTTTPVLDLLTRRAPAAS
jgi:Kef-type K+ transport system membrane component KefB